MSMFKTSVTRRGTNAPNPSFALPAVVGLLLLGAPAAGAQSPPVGGQPPGGQQPPPAAQSADLAISLSGSGGGSKVEEGETYRWEATVRNHGPGTARDVTVIVSPPEEFDLDDTNHEAECETNPGAEGRMVCRYGDLAAGAEFRLKFSGQFRDDERFRTHVFVQSTGPDADASNNHDSQGLKVHENVRRERVGDALACGRGPVTIIGGDSSSPFDTDGDDIEVIGDLEVQLNGETIFEDDDGMAEFPPSSGLDPIEFRADPGDRLRIIADSGNNFQAFLDPLTLVCQDGRRQELTDGVENEPAVLNQVFFDEEFVIELGRP